MSNSSNWGQRRHFGVLSATGVRLVNQDAVRFPDPESDMRAGDLYVVADGVGGQEDGEIAAQLAAQTIHDEYYALRTHYDAQTALSQAIASANTIVFEEAQVRQVQMGCTVVVALLLDDEMIVGHAGDARAYRLRGNTLQQLTKDHSWIQDQLDAGTINRKQATNHVMRHIVRRVLGNQATLEVEFNRRRWLPGDKLLLCSDGLHDVLSDRRIRRLLQQSDPQSAAEQLVQAALNAKSQDNTTGLVIFATDPSSPKIKSSRFTSPVTMTIIFLGLFSLILLAWQGLSRQLFANQQDIIPPTPTSTSISLPTSQTEIAAPEIEPTVTKAPTATPTSDVVDSEPDHLRHTVQKNEFLGTLSKSFDVDMSKIKMEDGSDILNPDDINEGQILLIPCRRNDGETNCSNRKKAPSDEGSQRYLPIILSPELIKPPVCLEQFV